MIWDTEYGKIYQHEIFYHYGGSTITPETLKIQVVWLDTETDTIWYKYAKEHLKEIKETSFKRFMSIVWR